MVTRTGFSYYCFQKPWNRPSIAHRSIEPHSTEWPKFIDMSYKYLSENWPHKLVGISEQEFKMGYDEKLRQRFTEGGRAVFLYYHANDPVCFSNVYITTVPEKTLNIAEFYVVPEYRRMGLASSMIHHLIKWGREEAVVTLKIEVDKDIERANRFWSAFGFVLDSTGERNVYSTSIS